MINLQRVHTLMAELEAEIRQKDSIGALKFKEAVDISRHLIFLHHEVISRYVDRAPDAPDQPAPRLEYRYEKHIRDNYPVMRDLLLIILLILILGGVYARV